MSGHPIDHLRGALGYINRLARNNARGRLPPSKLLDSDAMLSDALTELEQRRAAAPQMAEALALALFALEGSSREDEGRQATLAKVRAALKAAGVEP